MEHNKNIISIVLQQTACFYLVIPLQSTKLTQSFSIKQQFRLEVEKCLSTLVLILTNHEVLEKFFGMQAPLIILCVQSEYY